MEAKREVFFIDSKEIIVPEGRQRKSFNQGKLEELAESLKQYKQLQPGLCRKEEGKVILIAGERRLRACQLAEIPYAYTLYDEKIDINLAKELELEENLCRDDLTWQEEVEAKNMLHELYQKKGGKTSPGAKGGHTIEQTARILNQSKSTLSKELDLKIFMEFDDVRNAPTKTEAMKIVKRHKEAMAREVNLKKVLEKREREEREEDATSAYTFNFSEPNKEDMEAQLQKKMDYYVSHALHGEMEKTLKKFEDNHFQIVFFDPPWGVGFDEVKRESRSKKNYEDKEEDFNIKFPQWLSLIYKKMAEDSILFLFFGIANYSFVYDVIERTGFETNRMPLIWYKKGAHHTRNPKVWFGRSYEPIAYCRKGKKDIILQGASDIITTTAPTPKMKKDHPSAKHPDIYRNLLRRVAFPGDNVLDPMAGSGMIAVACESLQRTTPIEWTTIEKDEDFHLLTLANLMKGYEAIIADTTMVADPEFLAQKWEGKTFKDLNPGGEEWMNYWRDFPEEQEAMLEWQHNNQEAVS